MKTNKLATIFLFVLILSVVSCKTEKTQTAYNEKYRPQFHFSPPGNWMNDPNGLVFCDGEYHLYYQYYPDSTVWGPMHWGHAVSTDLIHWQNLPVALYPDTLGYIFSGSAVVDLNNSSGLQKGAEPPLVAIYTQHSVTRLAKGKNDHQNQSIAYSSDKGRTFVKYEGNPVLSNTLKEMDFRDPKVDWNESIQKWVMALAVGQKIKFFSSPDLKNWEYLSEFGSDAGAHGGVWECPDLFKLTSDGEDKWVLIVNINPGGPNGGSGTQYFIGTFDGKEFINDNPKETILWLDYGPDNYAGVTWSNIRKEDGRRLLIGWMSNWAYAQVTPTAEWRSANTLPRVLKLKNTQSGLRLSAAPVKELEKLRVVGSDVKLIAGDENKISGLNEIRLNVNLPESTAEEFGLIFSNSRGEQLTLGYNSQLNQFYSNRSKSGITEFSPDFAKIHYAPRISQDSVLSLHIYLDHPSLEMFADGGLSIMTEVFFPSENFNRVTFFQKNGEAAIQNCTIYDLNSIWN
jgi:fructan beta-fructosidase